MADLPAAGVAAWKHPPEEVDRPGAGLAFIRAAGVGVTVERHPYGIRLRAVAEDGPAADAGLRAGDVVVALDGASTDRASVEAFVESALGPAGTEVTYTVLRDGEEVDVTMVREEMED